MAYNFIESLGYIDDLVSNESKSLLHIPAYNDFSGDLPIAVKSTVVYIKVNSDAKSSLKDYKPLVAFMSEVNRIAMNNSNCKDISQVKDSIQIIYNTPKKIDVDTVIDDAARIHTLSEIVNKKFKDKCSVKISSSIGIDYGELLMIPVFQANGSKSFVWCGSPIETAKTFADKNLTDKIIISEIVWNNLKIENQRLFKENSYKEYFEGNLVNVTMNNWVTYSKD